MASMRPLAWQAPAWCRPLAALLWKNWKLLFQRKDPWATALEFVFPLLALLALGCWRVLADSQTIPDGWSDVAGDDFSVSTEGYTSSRWWDSLTAGSTTSPASTSVFVGVSDRQPTFAFQETTMAGLLLSLVDQARQDLVRRGVFSEADAARCAYGMLSEGLVSTNASAVNALPLGCDGLVAPHRLALVPDTTFTRDYFLTSVARWHPQLSLSRRSENESLVLTIPALTDVVSFFESEEALESYVSAKHYGLNASYPKIHAALVFKDFPDDSTSFGDTATSLTYSIRMNVQYGHAVGTAVSADQHQLWDPMRDHHVVTEDYRIYAREGFATLQTLVARFANCRPQWNATNDSNRTICLQSGSVANTSLASNKSDSTLDERLLGVLEGDDKIYSSWQTARALRTVLDSNSTVNSSAAFDFNATAFVTSADDDGALEDALLAPLRQLPQPYFGARSFPMPVSKIKMSTFYERAEKLFPMLLTAAYVYSVAMMIRTYINEAESHTREYLRVLGVRERLVWVSWYWTHGLALSVAALLQLVVASTFSLFPSSNAFLVFALLNLYGWSLWCFAFFVSAFFSSAQAGASVGVLLVITILFLEERLLAYGPDVISLVPQIAMAKAMKALLAAESMQYGISFGTMNELFRSESLGNGLGYLLLDCIMYTLLGLYFDRVIPKGDYGSRGRIAEPWYFPFLPSFWKRSFQKPAVMTPSSEEPGRNTPAMVPQSILRYSISSRGKRDGRSMEQVVNQDGPDSSRGTGLFYVSTSSTASRTTLSRPVTTSVMRSHLCFHRVTTYLPALEGQKTVLQNINLALPLGGISCIVGAPGAGKTALMSLLTLRSESMSGEVTFEEYSWSRHARVLCTMMGLCFEEDVLFPDLTVLDHLLFYAKLKCFEDDVSANREVRHRLEEFGLSHQRHVKATHLASGARRKLTLAIALLNDKHSKFVFLDEPTRGMDPYSRKRTWEVLRHNHQQDRTIVLTTQDIEEAEALGDQIGVLANGQMVFFGKADELKARFRMGYTLTLYKTSSRFHEDAVVELLTSLCTRASMCVSLNSEEKFVVSIPAENSPCFPELFQRLETQQYTLLGVAKYELSMATLEDAFPTVLGVLASPAVIALSGLPLVNEDMTTRLDVEEVDDQSNATVLPSTFTPTVEQGPVRRMVHTMVKTSAVIFAQVIVLVEQRLRVLKRTGRSTFCTVVLPVVLAFMIMAIMGSFKTNFDHPSFELSADALAEEMKRVGNLHVPYYCILDDNSTTNGSVACAQVFGTSVWDDASPVGISTTSLSQADGSGSNGSGSSESSVVVFGVDYSEELANSSSPSASSEDLLVLQLAELLFDQGFDRSGGFVSNQFAGLLVYSSTEDAIFGYDMLVNTSSAHASGIFKAEVDQAVYRALAGNSSLHLTVSNHPLPLTSDECQTAISEHEGVTMNAFLVLLAFSYMPAVIITRVVGDRSSRSNVKHQQFLAGVRVPAFWVANYATDLLLYFISAALLVLAIVAWDVSAWVKEKDGETEAPVGATITLLVLFGPALCTFTYCASFCFHEGRDSRVTAFLLFAVLSYSLFIVCGPIGRIGSGVAQFFQDMLSFTPHFALGYGLHLLAQQQSAQVSGEASALGGPFAGNVTGVSILYLAATAWLYMGVVLALEMALTHPDARAYFAINPYVAPALESEGDRVARPGAEEEDEGVRGEAQRVTAQLDKKATERNDVILVQEITKVFGRGKARSDQQTQEAALRSVSFGVAKGECLALLGVQSSGCSTLLRILSGEILPSTGRVMVDGKDAVWSHKQVRESRCIGYCPPGNGTLTNALSVREHLILRARLKSLGCGPAVYNALVDKMLNDMGLLSVQHRLVGSLQSGEQRRLCLALALLGSPSVVLLDDPTRGLDNEARQQVWRVLQRHIAQQPESTAMVVATSSLEECEALSTKVGVVLDGSLAYFDSYEELENRFEYGWVLEAKMADPAEGEVESLVWEHFEGDPTDAVLFEKEVVATCAQLGHADWAARFNADHPTGRWVAGMLARDGLVAAHTFCRWWAGECRYDLLCNAVEQAFGEEYVCLLRREPDACQFHLALEDAELKLSQVFKTLENVRARTQAIQDYAVSPSTFAGVMATFALRARAERELSYVDSARRLR